MGKSGFFIYLGKTISANNQIKHVYENWFANIFDNHFWHYLLSANCFFIIFRQTSIGICLFLHILANYFRKLYAEKYENINFLKLICRIIQKKYICRNKQKSQNCRELFAKKCKDEHLSKKVCQNVQKNSLMKYTLPKTIYRNSYWPKHLECFWGDTWSGRPVA